MRDQARASAWRAVALMLGAGWVVLACGGGGDEASPDVAGMARAGGALPLAAKAPPPGQGDARMATRAMSDAMPGATRAATPASAVQPEQPCPKDLKPIRPSPARLATARAAAPIEQAVDDELAAAASGGREQHAGTVEVADPFAPP